MKELTCDIAVVAAGPAGLAAAISAAEAGLEVIVCEKMNVTGGTANMGMGPFAVESSIQKDNMIDISVDDAFKEFMEDVHWHVDAHLVRDYFAKSASTIEWLEDMGVEFFGALKYFPSAHATWHVVKPDNGSLPGPRAASTMTRHMTERARELGVKILLETPVKQILRDENGVTGILATEPDGGELVCMAKAVIVATGGFGCNPEMIRQYTGYVHGQDIFNFRIPGIEGDGLKMAWAAGAGHSRTTMEKIYHVEAAIHEESLLAVSGVLTQPTLAVNLLGERVMNEELLEHTPYTANVIDIQKDKCIFTIFDDSNLRRYRKYNLDVPNNLDKSVRNPMANFDRLMAELDAAGRNPILSADSVEELADKIGCPREALVETVEAYNRCCDQNYDDVFGKPRKYLHRLNGPRFYAAKQAIGAYGSLGGIKVNYKTQVLTDAFDVIPGFYAAGTDICDIYDGTYVFTFPGNTMGFAVNTGRIAGENAAEYCWQLREK